MVKIVYKLGYIFINNFINIFLNKPINMKYALLGNNISYSLSPLIYDYWFHRYEIRASYEIIDIPIETLSESYFQNLFLKKGYKGINITKPFKEKVTNYLNDLSNEVKVINSTNNVVFNKKNNTLKGYNTDYLGILDSLKYYKLEINNKNILLIGAGGAAKSIVYACGNNAKNIYVQNRTYENISKLISLFDLQNLEEFKESNIDKIDIIINSSSIFPEEILKKFSKRKEIIFYDANYFYQEQKIENMRYYGGIMMLLYQAAHNFELWFGKKVEVDYNLMKRLDLK